MMPFGLLIAISKVPSILDFFLQRFQPHTCSKTNLVLWWEWSITQAFSSNGCSHLHLENHWTWKWDDCPFPPFCYFPRTILTSLLKNSSSVDGLYWFITLHSTTLQTSMIFLVTSLFTEDFSTSLTAFQTTAHDSMNCHHLWSFLFPHNCLIPNP